VGVTDAIQLVGPIVAAVRVECHGRVTGQGEQFLLGEIELTADVRKLLVQGDERVRQLHRLPDVFHHGFQALLSSACAEKASDVVLALFGASLGSTELMSGPF